MTSPQSYMLFSGPLFEFLENNKTQKGSGVRSTATHTSMTGGRFHVDSANQARFYQLLAAALGQSDLVIPCLTEQRSTVFGMYMDFDGKFPVPTISEASIARFMSVVTRQIRRFYVDMSEEQWERRVSRAVVLHKKGDAEVQDDGRYKHGLHIHFPNLLVKGEQAERIRMGILNGLVVNTWTDDFGVERPNWDEIVDQSVYSNGIRMIGAPKARKCGTCRANAAVLSCSECKKQNLGHHITPSCYSLCMAFENGVPSPDYFATLSSNATRLVRATSIRPVWSATGS